MIDQVARRCITVQRRGSAADDILSWTPVQLTTPVMTQSKSLPAPEGWTLQSHEETFSGRAGPYYFREEGPAPGVGFFARPHHANLGGFVHGGALLTLADMALFDICRRKIGLFRAVTVSLNSEFLRPGKVGTFIHASGETTAIGKSILFARGLVSADDKPLMNFSGTLKRLD
ncbi:PaaI family thioesterase [Hyphococcus flavus]|uniref:PaaI family thioesterase n=1 Tax=Hyphococcus flavus TaxID=1866326 RepID=A0AAE9ZEU1_9PROT|nr:PaaI family thioesterase [Hyphococcus flavus]WDI32450.1 PaaI family thioesterase [Hyphococcus flavus]